MNGGIIMSTDNKELETIASETETEEVEEATPKKKKLFTAKRIEVITAIFLGVTALLTARSSLVLLQSLRHGQPGSARFTAAIRQPISQRATTALPRETPLITQLCRCISQI